MNRSIFLLCSCSLIWTGCAEKEKKVAYVRPVRVMEALELSAEVTQTFPGIASATQEVNLSFRVEGPLVERPAQVGDSVETGDLLARLDSQDFALQVRSVEGKLSQARAALRRSERDYKRLVNIQTLDAGATTQKAVDEAQQDFESAEAYQESLEAQLQVAKNQLEYTELRAPFAGRVVATFVENFQDAAAKQEVLRLLDTSRIEMTISIPETSLPLLSNDPRLTVKFDLYPDVVLEARIKKVGAEASSVTRTYPITLIMEPPGDMLIFAGMAGEALLQARTPGDVALGVLVPASAIASDKYDRAYVWVVDKRGTEVRRRWVTLGAVQDGGVAISEGLRSGDWVVTAGVHYLAEGQQVQVTR